MREICTRDVLSLASQDRWRHLEEMFPFAPLISSGDDTDGFAPDSARKGGPPDLPGLLSDLETRVERHVEGVESVLDVATPYSWWSERGKRCQERGSPRLWF